MTGGLAAALLPVVESSGAIWVGSSGRLSPRAYGPVNMEIEALGTGALALLDMPAADYTAFYEGFANSALWPALHSRSDLIRVSDDDYQSYRRINSFVAQALLRFRKSNTAFWVQDYHFLALGEELRRLGVIEPIGFFLHTPWPAASTAVSVPHHRELIEAMLAYDVIGFQTEDDCQHFADYLRDELSLVVEDGVVRSSHGLTRLAAFPIGIDVDGFAAQAAKATTNPEVSRLRLSKGRRVRKSASFNKLCSFYGVEARHVGGRATGYNELLRNAIVDAWDGSEEHGRALLVVIKGLKGLSAKVE